jgi:hypothetical protein
MPFYYLAPIEGAMLALIICLLVASGIVEFDADSGASRGTMLFFYALAGFSGLFSRNVTRKLRDVANALFASPSRTDSA